MIRRLLLAIAAVLALGLGLGLLAGTARADAPASPVRVRIECEGYGRTKACPVFLLGFVEASKLMLSSPRATAEVVLYASTTEVALKDHLHLRFVGAIPGAPPIVEIDLDLDTRADDDAQRAQLEPAFTRGIALFVAARHPSAVSVTLTAPDGMAVATPVTSPYGVALQIGGFANYTRQFQNYNGFAELVLSRLTRSSALTASTFGSGGISRQPPLALDDGTEVSLDTEQWSLGASAKGAYLLCSCWSVGGGTRVWRDDPKGQFRYGWNARAAVEWDRYKADDPRGNRLAVLYTLGYQAEAYNLRNELGETAAHYPIHGVIASGSVRKDKLGIGLQLSISGELLHPERRHSISASPFIDWQLGDHIDLSLQVSMSKREQPAPDTSLIDPADYEQLSRLSFAEPFAANASLSLTIHWDRTNGARNDRLSDL